MKAKIKKMLLVIISCVVILNGLIAGSIMSMNVYWLTHGSWINGHQPNYGESWGIVLFNEGFSSFFNIASILLAFIAFGYLMYYFEPNKK